MKNLIALLVLFVSGPVFAVDCYRNDKIQFAQVCFDNLANTLGKGYYVLGGQGGGAQIEWVKGMKSVSVRETDSDGNPNGCSSSVQIRDDGLTVENLNDRCVMPSGSYSYIETK